MPAYSVNQKSTLLATLEVPLVAEDEPVWLRTAAAVSNDCCFRASYKRIYLLAYFEATYVGVVVTKCTLCRVPNIKVLQKCGAKSFTVFWGGSD